MEYQGNDSQNLDPYQKILTEDLHSKSVMETHGHKEGSMGNTEYVHANGMQHNKMPMARQPLRESGETVFHFCCNGFWGFGFLLRSITGGVSLSFLHHFLGFWRMAFVLLLRPVSQLSMPPPSVLQNGLSGRLRYHFDLGYSGRDVL
ncbi:hypothetical protein RIF29_03473 [Crotalaria pallida]|uniref:Uncharacterized protein n=1 Tax=Crotalaria pallida TaxID=3830 RepID=A0AAN9J106_CROPI